MDNEINVFEHYCAQIRTEYALLSKEAQNRLIAMMGAVMQDAYTRGRKDGAIYEREACLKDVEAEAEFPGEPAPELLKKMAEHPVVAARVSVSLTKKGIAKRILARQLNY